MGGWGGVAGVGRGRAKGVELIASSHSLTRAPSLPEDQAGTLMECTCIMAAPPPITLWVWKRLPEGEHSDWKRLLDGEHSGSLSSPQLSAPRHRAEALPCILLSCSCSMMRAELFCEKITGVSAGQCPLVGWVSLCEPFLHFNSSPITATANVVLPWLQMRGCGHFLVGGCVMWMYATLGEVVDIMQ
jgi:hypothetical protein